MAPWMMIALLGLVIVVFAGLIPRSRSKNGEAGGSKELVREMEETMDSFASDLEEQNNALIELFKNTKQEHQIEVAKLHARLEVLEQQRREPAAPVPAADQLAASQASASRGQSAVFTSAGIKMPVDARHEDPKPHSLDSPGAVEPIWSTAAASEEAVANVDPVASVRLRYAELLEMYSKGRSTEQIAKQFGMNKGEVMLILQLARQEDSARETK
ncbi:hypothetical protein [Paenibacillus lutrae]|uniref:Uncharacterized protein n=1 Tax=Paenibacillus lutrae TaxID=2078573 RepID=A0A7X3FG37_9BACL|nr:hypothetical protein [Paenibacillus lutrae]MVO99130.1 hypothetical protein [Paenibacillus lutrae]